MLYLGVSGVHQIHVKALLSEIPRAQGMWQCEPSHQTSC